MKQQAEVFEKYLDLFEKSVLTKNGYLSNERGLWTNKDTCFCGYFSPQHKVKINIILNDFNDGRFFIQVSMSSDEIGVHQAKKYFSLDKYISAHGLTNFRSVSVPGEDFELFTKHFFENLQTACETYLRDQITGVSFEEHDPWMGR